MVRYIFLSILLILTLLIGSVYFYTYAFFSDTAVSASNTFTTAETFGTPTPTETVLQAGKIVINEVSPLGNEDVEWVELLNVGGSTIDVTGWKIKDETTDVDIFPTTDPLDPGEYAVIIPSGSNVSSIPESATTIILADSDIGSGLNNGTESIFLLDGTDNEIDEMGYGTSNLFGGNIPALPGTGETLRRIPNGEDSDTANDWQAGSGTIGAVNN